MSDTYEIYAVKYAHHGPRSAALNFIGGDPHETSHDLDFYVWAVFNKDRTIVVDTSMMVPVGQLSGSGNNPCKNELGGTTNFTKSSMKFGGTKSVNSSSTV